MEWLQENHLVFFLLALAPELDLSAIYAVYEARDPVSSADPLVMPSRNLPSNAAGDPKANVQRNFTDPDSHNLKGGNGWIQGYNCQAAVDGDHQIIVSVGVSNQALDQHHFVPILQRIVANTGQLPEKLIADAGYCSTGNIEASEQRGLDAYLWIWASRPWQMRFTSEREMPASEPIAANRASTFLVETPLTQASMFTA